MTDETITTTLTTDERDVLAQALMDYMAGIWDADYPDDVKDALDRTVTSIESKLL